MKTKVIQINGALSTPVLVFGKPKVSVKPLTIKGFTDILPSNPYTKGFSELGKEELFISSSLTLDGNTIIFPDGQTINVTSNPCNEIPLSSATSNYKDARILGVRDVAKEINDNNPIPHYGWAQIQEAINFEYMNNVRTNYNFVIEVDNLEIRFCRKSEIRYILQEHFMNHLDGYLLGNYRADLLHKVLPTMTIDSIEYLQNKGEYKKIGDFIVQSGLQEKMANLIFDDYGIEEVGSIFAHYDGKVNQCIIDGYVYYYFYLNK